jgi:sporulation protein YlmC with PRC-barrel domain
MLIPYQRLLSQKIFSLRTGTSIGQVTDLVINPHNLHIDALFVELKSRPEPLVLLSQDIRELVPQGVAINDEDVLGTPGELIRLQEVLSYHFELLEKPVFSGGKRMGKVSGYAIDVSSLFIIKLYVEPPVWKSFGTAQLTIDRQSIIEITPRKIVISDGTIPVTAKRSALQSDEPLPIGYSASSAPRAALADE